MVSQKLKRISMAEIQQEALEAFKAGREATTPVGDLLVGELGLYCSSKMTQGLPLRKQGVL